MNENNQFKLKNIRNIAYDDNWWLKPGYADYGVYFGNDLISTFFLDDEKPNLYIRGFEIKEEFRGKGYAKKVLDLIYKYAKNKKYEKLTLNVSKKNEIAQKLYKSYGFIESEYQSDEIPVINMELEIK